ncbi:uncharacterized protein [Clytia hemisphaerica]|uniref:Uncharacterized protein n=1 Tax=Clytia hemisphaerica TaxID=252671 RepID=A0A7M5XEL7_9CNID
MVCQNQSNLEAPENNIKINVFLLNQKIDCISVNDVIHSAFPGTSLSKLKAILSERHAVPEDLIVLFVKAETSVRRCTGAYIEDLFFDETTGTYRREINLEFILHSFHPLMEGLCERHHIPYLKNIRLKTLTGEMLTPVTVSSKRNTSKNTPVRDMRFVKDLVGYLSENLNIPPWNQRLFLQHILLRDLDKSLVELYLEQQKQLQSEELVLCLAIKPPESVRITLQIPFAEDHRHTEINILETARIVDLKEHVRNMTGTPSDQLDVFNNTDDLNQTQMLEDQKSIWKNDVANFRIEKSVNVCIKEVNDAQDFHIFQKRYTILNYDTETVRRLKRRTQTEAGLQDKNLALDIEMTVSENTLLKNVNETICFRLADKEICRIS